MSDTEAEIRKVLARDARDLELLTHRLRQLLARLPASASRSEAEDLPDEWDEAAALRAVLQCVLADRLEPAVRELQAAARPAFRNGGENPPC
jgi:hypothetical protein